MNFFTMAWRGPFPSLESIKEDASLEHGIYAFIGIKKHQRNTRQNIKLQYIGKTKNHLYTRLKQHHKLDLVNRNLSIWFGQVTNKRAYDLEEIEHIFISFSQDSALINEKKLLSYPASDCTILSEFLKRDGKPYARLPQAVRSIPEVIVWQAKKKLLRYVSRLHIINDPNEL